MKKLILIVLFLTTALFSNSNTSAPDLEVLGKEADIYDGNFEIESQCKPTCRILQEGFLSKVVDFNPFTGITKCIVTKKELNESNEFYLTADTKNSQCVDATKPEISVESLASYNTKISASPDLEYRDTKSLSKILAGIGTLDSDIVNIESTVATNSLIVNDGKAFDRNITRLLNISCQSNSDRRNPITPELKF